MSEIPILQFSGATKTFEVKPLFGARKRVEALRDVSVDLPEGQALAIVGESGSGKSTLGRAAIGLFHLTGGQVLYRGQNIAGMRKGAAHKQFCRSAQMIFQDPFSALNPAHTVAHHLERPLKLHHNLSGRTLKNRLDEVLEEVELDAATTAPKYPHELSGGQRQRVNLARALAVGAELIVADEPTSMLDVSIRQSVLDLMARLKTERGLSLLYITHDIATAHSLAEHTAVMFAGRVVEYGPSKTLISNPGHPYTKILLSAVPNPGLRFSGNAEEGRAFSEHAEEVRRYSRGQAGGLVEVGPGHFVRAAS